MANRRRGEIEAVVDGAPVTLCLTLGALCELEAAFGADDLVALAERFASGRLAARDLLRIFACALRGGGRTASDADVAAMRIDGGLAGLGRIVADLLEVTFGASEGTADAGRAATADGPRVTSVSGAEGETPPRPPYPGGGPPPSPGMR